jgi:hypothetical protein
MDRIRLAFGGYGGILCTAASSARTPFARGSCTMVGAPQRTQGELDKTGGDREAV